MMSAAAAAAADQEAAIVATRQLVKEAPLPEAPATATAAPDPATPVPLVGMCVLVNGETVLAPAWSCYMSSMSRALAPDECTRPDVPYAYPRGVSNLLCNTVRQGDRIELVLAEVAAGNAIVARTGVTVVVPAPPSPEEDAGKKTCKRTVSFPPGSSARSTKIPALLTLAAHYRSSKLSSRWTLGNIDLYANDEKALIAWMRARCDARVRAFFDHAVARIELFDRRTRQRLNARSRANMTAAIEDKARRIADLEAERAALEEALHAAPDPEVDARAVLDGAHAVEAAARALIG